MAKTAICPMFRREGFSLIELVVVMVVIAILVAFIIQMRSWHNGNHVDRRSQAFVQRVAMAADAFKGENNGRFPGQDHPGLLKGSVPQAGPYTGSQILAARLFDYPDEEINNTPVAGVSATSKYLEYKSYLLIKESSTGESIPNNSLADDSRTANALLYFPSRLNVTATGECYKWDDNSDYITKDVASANAEFNQNCIRNPKLSDGTIARWVSGILIIGTGPNDTYLESTDNDDIKNWEID